MDKKKGVLFGLIASVVLSLISSVSAYWGSSYGGYFGGAIDSVVMAWEPIFGAIFGGFGWSGMYLFERVLLFVILMVVVYLALLRVPMFEGNDNGKKTFRWLIAIIVPLIGIRWIDYQWLSSIVLHYTFLAIVLTTVLPFLIYFYFIYSMYLDSWLRKIAWIFFIGIYLGLWQSSSQVNSTIYMWTLVASLICLFMDSKIAGWYMRRIESEQQLWQRQQHLAAVEKTIQEMIKDRDKYNDKNMFNKKLKELMDFKAQLLRSS
jgi:hypothetical protein